MSASAQFYVIGKTMEKATVENSAAAATAHPLESGLDHNLDTFWQQGGATSDGLIVSACRFNLGSPQVVDGCAYWQRNSSSSLGAGQLEFSWSDDGAAWNIITAWLIMDVGGTAGVALKLFPPVGPATAHQYWRMTWGGTITTRVEVSQFFLYKQNSVTVGNQFPEIDVEHSFSRSFRPSGGLRYVSRFQRTRMREINRVWPAAGETDFQAVQNSHRDSFGPAFPAIFTEGSTSTVVRFLPETFTKNQFDFQLFNVGVKMLEIPYIEHGETF